MKTFVIESTQPFVKDFNGQRATLDEARIIVGASGDTKLYGLTSGGALFLRDDEVRPA